MIGGMEIDVVQWIILFFGTAAAGWVDAVIGGGGLILIPMLLAVLPGLAPAAALGTSKLAAVTGTGSAAVTLARKVKLDKAEMARFILIALVCSGLGASVASSLDKDVMRPSLSCSWWPWASSLPSSQILAAAMPPEPVVVGGPSWSWCSPASFPFMMASSVRVPECF